MNREYIESLFINKEIYYRGEHSFYTKIDLDKIIENILMRYKLEVGELEAKVYTYEKIIANSNFKSILSKDKQSYEKRINELEKQIQENTNEKD